MKIRNINYSLKNNRARLSSEIVLKSGKKHYIYFEVDSEFGDFIAKDASPFLPVALGIAMKRKENLEIEDSISERLMVNMSKIMRILEGWELGFKAVSIRADFSKTDLKKSKRVGCFFSGGVDSFYTYLKNKNKIDYLIFVHGFDINIKDSVLFKKIERNIVKIASEEKIKLIRVRTNVRETFEQYFDWDFSHGFAIACVVLFLRHGLKGIYASCGLPNKNTDHHFMTPELDSLWSSENMKIIHYGCDADKIEKLNFLSNYKLVMDNLRVCWVNTNKKYNCSECEKCFRNMLGLYVSDSLEKCGTFNKKLDLNKLKNTRVSEYCLKYFTAILEVLKLKNDKSAVRIALEELIKNNKSPKIHRRLFGGTRDFIRFFDNKYNANRLYWFLAQRGFIR